MLRGRNMTRSANKRHAWSAAGTAYGIAAGQAQEMPSASAAIRRAELMSRDPLNAGALAFRRTGNPNSGDFGEPLVLKSFGDVPNTLDEA
jgi:hypothetical protein